MKNITQDKVSIIGTLAKLEPARVSRTGLPSVYLVISVPNEHANQPIYIPCTLYGKEADILEKKRLAFEIKVDDLVEIQGSHYNKKKDGRWTLEIKAKSIEKYQKEKTLFGGKS